MSDKQEEPDAFLPLPDSVAKRDWSNAGQAESPPNSTENPAANLIRQKVEAAYSQAPDINTEAQSLAGEPETRLTKHQKFIVELTSSGKSIEEIQTGWHDYYAALTDVEKHQVWQEFYSAQAAESTQTKGPAVSQPAIQRLFPKKASALKKLEKRQKMAAQKPKAAAHSLGFGLAAGTIAVAILLFGFFNERFIAPFIQPSRSLSSVPLISNSAVGTEPEIIIPKINVQIPVVYDLKSIEESAVQKALEDGVVHYADTATPGQNGNVVIVGHSSNNIFNKGKYKFAFVLLSRLEPGDTFYLHKDGKRYTYEVYQKKVVKPNDVSVLGPADKPAAATLITCDPPGTSINRLVVTGEQISPDPDKNGPQTTKNTLATKSKIIPGNSQSLWARIWSLLSR